MGRWLQRIPGRIAPAIVVAVGALATLLAALTAEGTVRHAVLSRAADRLGATSGAAASRLGERYASILGGIEARAGAVPPAAGPGDLLERLRTIATIEGRSFWGRMAACSRAGAS